MDWPITAGDELVGFISLRALTYLGGYTAPALHRGASWETGFSITIEIQWKLNTEAVEIAFEGECVRV